MYVYDTHTYNNFVIEFYIYHRNYTYTYITAELCQQAFKYNEEPHCTSYTSCV